MQNTNLVAWLYIGFMELVWKLSLTIKISLRVQYILIHLQMFGFSFFFTDLLKLPTEKQFRIQSQSLQQHFQARGCFWAIAIVIVLTPISVVGAVKGIIPPSLFVTSYPMQQLLSLGSMGPNIHGWVVEVVEFM